MKSRSIYKSTGINGGFLSYYTPINIPKNHSSNFIVTISKKYVNKPGLLAFDLYGDANLRWVFRYFNANKINDPIFDLVEGLNIIVPTKERLMRYV